MSLQEKISNAFMGKVVRKDLAFLVKGGLPVPTYVLEYLLEDPPNYEVVKELKYEYCYI